MKPHIPGAFLTAKMRRRFRTEKPNEEEMSALSLAVGALLEDLIQIYGEENGKTIWKKIVENQRGRPAKKEQLVGEKLLEEYDKKMVDCHPDLVPQLPRKIARESNRKGGESVETVEKRLRRLLQRRREPWRWISERRWKLQMGLPAPPEPGDRK